eukprot:1182592-Prorocentrum_minimum.AAC.3
MLRKAVNPRGRGQPGGVAWLTAASSKGVIQMCETLGCYAVARVSYARSANGVSTGKAFSCYNDETLSCLFPLSAGAVSAR